MWSLVLQSHLLDLSTRQATLKAVGFLGCTSLLCFTTSGFPGGASLRVMQSLCHGLQSAHAAVRSGVLMWPCALRVKVCYRDTLGLLVTGRARSYA